MTTCRTCPQPLDSISIHQGCKRCKVCRAKRPGRQYTKRERPLRFAPERKHAPAGEGITIHGRGKREQHTCLESYWIGATREELQQHIARRQRINGRAS